MVYKPVTIKSRGKISYETAKRYYGAQGAYRAYARGYTETPKGYSDEQLKADTGPGAKTDIRDLALYGKTYDVHGGMSFDEWRRAQDLAPYGEAQSKYSGGYYEVEHKGETVGMSPAVYEKYKEARQEEKLKSVRPELYGATPTHRPSPQETQRVEWRPEYRERERPTYYRERKTPEEMKREARIQMQQMKRETPYEFFFEQPRPKEYYEAVLPGGQSEAVQFARASAFAFTSSLNPANIFQTEEVDISTMGGGMAEPLKAKEAVEQDPIKAAGFGSGLVVSGILTGKLFGKVKAYRDAKVPKKYEVKYWKGTVRSEATTEFIPLERKIKEATYMGLDETGTKKITKTNALETFIVERDKPSSVRFGFISEKEVKGGFMKSGKAHEFVYGSGRGEYPTVYKVSRGTVKEKYHIIETRIEKKPPAAITDPIDIVTTEKGITRKGTFEGGGYLKTDTREIIQPIKMEEDTFKVSIMKGKNTGRNVIEELGKAYTPEARPDYYDDLLKMGKKGGTLEEMAERVKRSDFFGEPRATTATKQRPYTVQTEGVPIAFEEVTTTSQMRPFMAKPDFKEPSDMIMTERTMKTYAGAPREALKSNLIIAEKTTQGRIKGGEFKLSERGMTDSSFKSIAIPKMGIAASEKPRQVTRQTQKLIERLKFTQKPFTPDPIRTTPRATPTQPKGFSFPGFSTKKTPKAKSLPLTGDRGEGTLKKMFKRNTKKAFLSDPFSVMESRAKYGKATSPELTELEWKKAKKSGFMKVPTLEMKGLKIRRFKL